MDRHHVTVFMNSRPVPAEWISGELGQLGQVTRVVVLRGTTTVSQVFSPNIFDVFGWASDALRQDGFSLNGNIRYDNANTFGYAMNIEIEANVELQYTAEQVRQRAIQVIESVTANWGFNKVFSNTTLSVVSDAMPATQQPGTGSVPGPGPGGSSNPPSQHDQTNNQPVLPGGNFDFFTALGLTTPFAIAGALVVGFLILRK